MVDERSRGVRRRAPPGGGGREHHGVADQRARARTRRLLTVYAIAEKGGRRWSWRIRVCDGWVGSREEHDEPALGESFTGWVPG